ncbi:MAG: hypothetical protein ACRDWI_05575 [Jiangellaceae bacterium]
MTRVRATIAHQKFTMDRSEVERRLREELPEPLDEHFVVIGGRRFPPKQVVGVVTGLDRADFNTHQARRILSRLGFAVSRRSHHARTPSAGPARRGPHGGQEADALRPHVGQWVAQRGLEVLVAADTPEVVLAWLERHNEKADGMFRVPASDVEATGAAPL